MAKKRQRRAVGVIILLLLLVLGESSLYPYGMPIHGKSRNIGENGVWLHYRWYLGQGSKSELQSRARRFRDEQIRYAYFHVRSVDFHGRLRFRSLPSARQIVRTVHHESPGQKAIAWVYAGNRRGRGAVNLANSDVRRTMASEANWLTKECGFDGVQWDYEISSNGDPDFLKLLRETRSAMPKGKLLCVATPLWLPRLFQHWGWNDEYFRQVAAECDQMAVMAYDSGIWLPRGYVWLVRQQVIHVTQAAGQGNPHCRVLIGVPTYEEGGLSHRTRAENLALTLRGVREGLADSRAVPGVFAGVALFSDDTTDSTEWETYRTLWLRPSS